MILQTDRLILRSLTASDIDNIHELHSLPETDEFNTLGIPDSLQSTGKLVKEWMTFQNTEPQSSYIFCITLIDTMEFIGLIGLNIGKEKYKTAEIWYKIHKNYWRKGYATEALIKLLDFGFNELQLHRIEAGCAVENIASIKVLEKVGFMQEGRKRKKLPIRGAWKDNYFYAILEEDFGKSAKIET